MALDSGLCEQPALAEPVRGLPGDDLVSPPQEADLEPRPGSFSEGAGLSEQPALPEPRGLLLEMPYRSRGPFVRQGAGTWKLHSPLALASVAGGAGQGGLELSAPCYKPRRQVWALGTLLRANNLVKELKATGDFVLKFHPLNLEGAGQRQP